MLQNQTKNNKHFLFLLFLLFLLLCYHNLSCNQNIGLGYKGVLVSNLVSISLHSVSLLVVGCGLWNCHYTQFHSVSCSSTAGNPYHFQVPYFIESYQISYLQIETETHCYCCSCIAVKISVMLLLLLRPPCASIVLCSFSFFFSLLFLHILHS